MLEQVVEIRVGSSGIPTRVETVQGDSGRSLICFLADMIIPEGASARIYGQKPSKLEIYNDCVISGNYIIVDLTNQILAEIGTVACQIEIAKDGECVTSFDLYIEVKKRRASKSAIESTNEFTALEKALQKAESVTDPIITFSEATERKNLISGSKLSIIIGNISKWLKDLKTAAFMDVANNDTTTEEGYVADARAVKDLGLEIDELNTKIAYEYQYILVGEINIGQAQKFGRIVELDLSNLTVASGTTESDILFTLASSYAPKNQVDFCDTYGNVRFRIDTAGNAKLAATINEKSFLRGTFMYISAS